MPTPSSGVCAPWTTVANVIARPGCSGLDQVVVVPGAISDASNILWALSQKKFSGVCTGYARPNAMPMSWEAKTWALANVYGYNKSWGMCNSGHEMGYTQQCWTPPTLDLGVYPLVSVSLVTIDGITIPSNEYRIDNNKLLTRIRLSAAATPTEMWGWPTCQNLDLPDTEIGTLAVTYSFGMAPPTEGVSAATALAAALALSRSGNASALPQRITSITRQQVQMAVMDPMAFLNQGLTGIYEADLFIRVHNPDGTSRRRPGVWSPDMGTIRRPT